MALLEPKKKIIEIEACYDSKGFQKGQGRSVLVEQGPGLAMVTPGFTGYSLMVVQRNNNPISDKTMGLASKM